MRIEHSIDIAAPIAAVWQLTIDVESWPSITPTITSVEPVDGDPLSVGSRVRLKQPGQPERVWTVTELESEQRFAWSTRAIGTTMTASHELVESSSGTTNTLTVDIEGPLSSIVGAVLRGPISKAIAAENQGFKTAAEK